MQYLRKLWCKWFEHDFVDNVCTRCGHVLPSRAELLSSILPELDRLFQMEHAKYLVRQDREKTDGLSTGNYVLPVLPQCKCEAQATKRKWVKLTDEQILVIEETTTCTGNESWLRKLARNVEAKSKELNNG